MSKNQKPVLPDVSLRDIWDYNARVARFVLSETIRHHSIRSIILFIVALGIGLPLLIVAKGQEWAMIEWDVNFWTVLAVVLGSLAIVLFTALIVVPVKMDKQRYDLARQIHKELFDSEARFLQSAERRKLSRVLKEILGSEKVSFKVASAPRDEANWKECRDVFQTWIEMIRVLHLGGTEWLDEFGFEEGGHDIPELPLMPGMQISEEGMRSHFIKLEEAVKKARNRLEDIIKSIDRS